MRIAGSTVRVLAVIAALGGQLACPAASAEEPSRETVQRAIRTLLRGNLPVADRLEAAATVLEAPSLADATDLVRGGLALHAEAPSVGAWLVLHGTDGGAVEEDLRREGAGALTSRLENEALGPVERAVLSAAGCLLGRRPPGVEQALTASWPPEPVVAAVLLREAAWPPGTSPGTASAQEARRVLAAQAEAARALDRAASDDPQEMRLGLDALLALGPEALPLLAWEVERAARPEAAPGRAPRAVRAALALGLLGDRRAAPALAAALDAPDGWLQATAAAALGDLGEPAAAPALCRKITYRGDVLRPRDEWTYPGVRETSVPPEDWADVDYFAVDCAVADALLRLGVKEAAGWLIRQKLDPSRAWFRIRVLQDAVDALGRALPHAPVDAYAVDAGLPQRREGYERLSSWWTAHRDEEDLLGRPFPEDDAGFRREARRVAERLRGRSVMELQMARETCALLGPAMTRTLVEALAVTTSRVHRREIVSALGAVRDPRAVATLLAVLGDESALLRATAAEALGPYVAGRPDVVRVLLRLVEDREPQIVVGALRALVEAPPSGEVRAALGRTSAPDEDREMRIARTVALLVQEGPGHWEDVYAGLCDSERYVRRIWWELLRRALDLPDHLYDATVDPDAPGWRAPDAERILQRLARRRTS